MDNDAARLKEAETQLLKTHSPEEVARAMRLIEIPAYRWTKEDAAFMERVRIENTKTQQTRQGLGCLLVIFLALSGVVAFLIRK